MIQNGSAQRAMFSKESGDLGHLVDARTLADGDVLEALIVVNGVFFRACDGGCFEHRGNLGPDVVGVIVGVDPSAMQIAGIIGGEAGNIYAGGGGVGSVFHLSFRWVLGCTCNPLPFGENGGVSGE